MTEATLLFSVFVIAACGLLPLVRGRALGGTFRSTLGCALFGRALLRCALGLGAALAGAFRFAF